MDFLYSFFCLSPFKCWCCLEANLRLYVSIQCYQLLWSKYDLEKDDPILPGLTYEVKCSAKCLSDGCEVRAAASFSSNAFPVSLPWMGWHRSGVSQYVSHHSLYLDRTETFAAPWLWGDGFLTFLSASLGDNCTGTLNIKHQKKQMSIKGDI